MTKNCDLIGQSPPESKKDRALPESTERQPGLSTQLGKPVCTNRESYSVNVALITEHAVHRHQSDIENWQTILLIVELWQLACRIAL